MPDSTPLSRRPAGGAFRQGARLTMCALLFAAVSACGSDDDAEPIRHDLDEDGAPAVWWENRNQAVWFCASENPETSPDGKVCLGPYAQDAGIAIHEDLGFDAVRAVAVDSQDEALVLAVVPHQAGLPPAAGLRYVQLPRSYGAKLLVGTVPFELGHDATLCLALPEYDGQPVPVGIEQPPHGSSGESSDSPGETCTPVR